MPATAVFVRSPAARLALRRALAGRVLWWWLGAVLLVGMAGAGWWWQRQGSAPAAPPGAAGMARFGPGGAAQPVSVGQVQRADVRVLVSAIGTLNARATAVVRAKVAAREQALAQCRAAGVRVV